MLRLFSTIDGGLTVRRRSLARRLHCDADLQGDLIDRIWRHGIDELFHASELLQAKNRCIVARYDEGERSFLLKRHVWGDWARTARMLLREPAPRLCARMGLWLADQGVPTPRPRATVECRIGPFGYRSYLMTDYVDGTTLYRYVRSGAAAADELPDLARQVAAIWERLIELGVSHNDLKPENFIVDPSRTVWLIDLEKSRVHRRKHELPGRHLVDLKRFLHVRTWRTHADAAEPFRLALLGTSLGKWILERGANDHLAARSGYSQHELGSGLTVVVVANEQDQDAGVAESITSAYDIADELVLVSASSRDRFDVLRHFPTIETEAGGTSVAKPWNRRGTTRMPRHPWVLVLHAGERITPELARQLPERIVERTNCDAVRIPIQLCDASAPNKSSDGKVRTPIRLFHQDRCSYSMRGGELVIAVDPDRVAEFPETIHRTRLLELNQPRVSAISAAKAA